MLDGFALDHPDALLLVSPEGVVGWANEAARGLLDAWQIEVGERLPSRIAEDLATRIANGATRALLIGGAGDPPLDAFLGSGGSVWIHARGSDEALGAQVQAARAARGAFLANMSHELRTPLNAILGYSGLLSDDAMTKGDVPLTEDLGRIDRAASHLLRLIDDLLDVSRIESGRMGLFLETFPIDVLLLEVVDTVRPLAHARSNEVVLDVSDILDPLFRSDRTKVRQILFNLLDNATRYTQGGRIDLIGRVRGEGGGRELVLTVRDTGLGIAPERMARLFEPFLQTETVVRQGGRTGLGLALSRLLCGMLGAKISASSELGRGSQFEVVMPYRTSLVPGVTPVGAPTVPVVGSVRARGTVLVIDDDGPTRDLIARYISNEGYRVALAPDGESGLRAARELRPDAITLDVMMPRVDGWEVLRRLREDPEVGQIPVIVVSIVDDDRLGFALGASGYLAKPIDRHALIDALAPYRSSARRVLVADDDPDHRELVTRTLERVGWTVEAVSDGGEMLQRLEHMRPDVVLVDLMMPDVDGFQVVTTMRSHPEWASIPIVVVTALDLGPADRDRLRDAVQAVVGKGSGVERLLEELRTVVRPLGG